MTSTKRLLLLSLCSALTFPAHAQTTATEDPVTAHVIEDADGEISFAGAAAQALPQTVEFNPAIVENETARAIAAGFSTRVLPQVGLPAFRRGAVGSGETHAETLVVMEETPAEEDDTLAPTAVGTAGLPFTAARADVSSLRLNEEFPYRAIGKLFFVDGSSTFSCSGTMIDRGLMLTAAHCVSAFGQNRFFETFRFAPGFRNGQAPFDVWSAQRVYAMTSYLDGTDNCDPQNPGIVCENDIAIIVLEPEQDDEGNDEFAGDLTGFLTVGWNQAGYAPNGTAQITQLGYPGALDDGRIMQRNDALATISATFVGNSVLPSLFTKGSSGGPNIVNFGTQPRLAPGVTPGFEAARNMVVGVTSWGSTDDLVKRMGFSPFRDTNVAELVDRACADVPDACS